MPYISQSTEGLGRGDGSVIDFDLEKFAYTHRLVKCRFPAFVQSAWPSTSSTT
jgi:hypothetical protein